MTKEVALSEQEKALSLGGMFDTSLQSSGDTLDKADLRISKLTLIQDMTKSDFNTEGAPVGNYIDSIEKTDLGSSIDVYVMTDLKLWEVKYAVKEKGKLVDKYLGTVDYTLENEDLRKNPRIPVELKEKAEELGVTDDMISQTNAILRFFVLKADEVQEGNMFPYVVDFKRSSYAAGTQLKNTLYKMRQNQKMPLPSYAKVFTLGSLAVESEHKYQIKTVKMGELIDKENVSPVEKWVREMQENRQAYAQDESDQETEEDSNTVEAEVVTDGRPKF